ncbi:MAG: flagellar biosynthesis anti-sigma factor FlgM [Betaproteobacteria bacterium]|nr:flagellar biosynthesis anti-sigma factor FlgM [Betaproteobacteria bacterium]
MKISDSKGLPQGLEKRAAKPANGAANGHAAVASTGGGEQIRISDLSSQLSSLETSLSASPEFDAGRVEAIKTAIRDGQFKINPEAIADKLLASVEEFLKKPH